MKQKPIFAYWLDQRPGETDKMWRRRIAAAIRGDDVRVKTDLKDFKTADFTLAPERDFK